MSAIDRKAWFQLLTTAGLLALNWLLMLKSLQLSYWLTLLLAIPAVGLQIRLFIFLHDCGHSSFFKSRKMNNAVGAAIGVVTLTPFAYWRRTHAIHHGTSGDLDRRGLGDVETLTVKEYRERSRWGRLKYRLYRHPFVLLGIGPIYQFVLKQRLARDVPRAWKREWAGVMWARLAIAAAVLAGGQLCGLQRFLLGES
ncbi:MAG: fatty acid desaturase, partial [bacterium]|nr:fatty acid desaturase [bacterium]